MKGRDQSENRMKMQGLKGGFHQEKFYHYVYALAKIHAVMINDRFIQGKIDRFKVLLGKNK